MLRGCLVCVICNSNSIHSFILKLCIMIAYTLKMCTLYFMHISRFFYVGGGGGGVNLDIFKCLDGFWFVSSVTPSVFIP